MDILEYITFFDFVACLFGIIIRFAMVINKKVLEFNEFSFTSYFNLRHKIRWSIHVLMSFGAVVFLPGFIIEIVSANVSWLTLTSWASFGSLIFGVIGYDFWKLFEKAGVSLVSKLGVKLDE